MYLFKVQNVQVRSKEIVLDDLVGTTQGQPFLCCLETRCS